MTEQQDIKKVLDVINEYSASTINQIKAIPEAHLTRMVAGQLRTTIKAHGAIDSDGIGSAAKRISTQLLGSL